MELSQVLQALRNADAAGDTEAARRLAQMAQQMQVGAPAQEAVKPKGGVAGAFGKGLESLVSSMRTAGEAIASPETAARAGLGRQEDLERKYADEVSFEKVKQAYEQQGLLAATKEVAGQIPKAIAEQAPNIAATLGSARAGAALGSFAGPVGTIVGGVAGAALPTLVSQFGSNVERQAAEQVKEGQPIEINRAAALGAAVPQAALDVAGTLIPLGGRLVSKLTGIPEKALALGAGNAAKLAEERLATTLAKGTAVGAVAEIPTEVAQQMLERMQAGLSLTSPDALAEYGQTAYQVGLLAPIGAAGRVSERGSARQEVQRQKEEEARKAAAEAEAAKNTPEALRQLDMQYRAAEQKLAQINAQVDALKPGKSATAEQKAAYEKAKVDRATFINSEFKPLKQEFGKRKDAIEQLQAQEQSAMEIEAAPTQVAAKEAIPSEAPKLDVQSLMLEQDALRQQMAQLESQLGQAAPEQFDTLNAQRQELQKRIDARATLIEERGGTPLAAEEFQQATAAKMQALDTKLDKVNAAYTTALENKEYDAAAKAKDELLALRQEREALTNKTAQQMQALQEKQAGLEQRGATRDLFAEAPATAETETDRQLRAQTLEEERQRGLYGPESTKEAAKQAFEQTEIGPRGQLEPITPIPESTAKTGIKPKQLEAVQQAQDTVATAQAELDKAVKTKDTETLYTAIDKLNQAKDAETRAQEDVGRSLFRPVVLDIFSPANVLNTAIQNNDTKLINDIAAHSERTALRAALDEKTSEREKLVQVLEGRLDSKGLKRERVDLFSKLYNPKQQALFKNGTYPDREMQRIYDQGGPAAVEYETVLQEVEPLMKKVTTKQGNAKQSLYEQAVTLYAELEALNAQLESGIAKPTMREKAAGLQAKLGKGQAPAERPMDEAEKYQLQRKITATTNKYNMVVGKITPIRDEILALYDNLYKTTPLEKPSVVAAKKAKEAEAAGRGPKAVSRTARTAARLARGDVRKEAEASTQMRDLAMKLGMEEPEYDKFGEGLVKRLKALEAKYGKNDYAVTSFRIQMNDDLKAKAIEIGKKTPEYKATLKEQVAYFQEVLPTAGKQEVPTKRTGAVTRKQSGAPKRLVTSSPESRAQSEAEALRMKRSTLKDFKEALDSEKYGTAYRFKENEADTTVDAAEAQKVIDGLKLPENVKFVYAATPRQIPARLLNEMAKDGVDADNMVQGAVFPDGTVLVVGDQHADIRDLEETIAHELIGHYGVDTVIGIDRLNAFAKKTDVIKLAQDLGGKPLVSEVLNTVRANAALGRSEEVQKLQALREIIAHTEEARVTEAFREKAGRWLKELVGMVRAGLRAMGLKNLGELSTSDVFYMLKQSRKAFANKSIGAYRAADGTTAFRLRKQASPYTTIGGEPGIVDKLMGNMLGLAGRVQFIDQYAALDAATKKGLEAGVISSLEATNANYLLRFGQQRSQFAGQFLTNGPVKVELTKKDGGVETLYRSTKGTSMVDVANELNKAKLGNETEQEHMFTLYLAGKRADQVGWEKLNFKDPSKARAEYADVLNRLNGDAKAKAAFEEAAKLYQEYNAGLLDFLVDTGALSAKKAAELKAISYVPFYRINANGEVQLMIDKEHPVRIANIKDQPQLKELVGGNTAILPIFTSAAQNTFMITGMGLRNQAVKETAFMLKKLGIASAVREGKGPQGDNVVRFMKNGEQYYALVDTDMYGVPAELIVRGMEGIKTTLPAVIKAMAIPANILRSFVVRNPAYAVRQVIRDPLNAWLTTGTDATPVLSSMKELASMVAGRSDAERKLMETGAISSNVFSGDEQDMAKFLKDLAAGKSMWDKALARLDAFALQGDAATRAVIYKDSLAKGMSEQEALLRTLESMNFSRRGVSPSMQALSVMIPFFNAQVQGMDVIYRAFKGDMPYSEQLKIREKLVQRGLLLAAGTLAYAAMMEDDEAYKRARPEERYANWFVHVPGFDEPVRVPIPFEMGFLFKALPEAIWNTAMQDDKAEKAVSGLFKLAQQTNPFSLPQAVKPLTEAVLGKSFYGGDIESAREKGELATERYRDNTTELAKTIGAVTGKVGVSPITIDYLIRGYTGGLGVALVQLANPLLATDTRAEIAEPTTKISKMPFIGGLFQPVEGRGTLDEAYDRMTEIQQTKGTYNKLVEQGRRAEAQQFAQEYADKLAAMSVSGSVQKRLGEMAKMERQIKADPRMTTEQKDAKLEQLDKAKMALARQFLAITDRTTPR